MKKQSVFLLLTAFISVLAISCNKTEESKPAFDLSAAKKEIEDINKTFMELVVKHDSVAIANLYSEDAKVMFGGAPAAVGRAAIQTTFHHILNSGLTKVDIITTEVFGTEELLAEEGVIVIYVNENVVAEEKSIVLWKKVDGQWKLFRDISNPNSKE